MREAQIHFVYSVCIMEMRKDLAFYFNLRELTLLQEIETMAKFRPKFNQPQRSGVFHVSVDRRYARYAICESEAGFLCVHNNGILRLLQTLSNGNYK